MTSKGYNMQGCRVVLKSHLLHRDFSTVENSGNSFSFTHIPLPCMNLSFLFYFCSLHKKSLSIRIYVRMAGGRVVKSLLHVDRESLSSVRTKMLPSGEKLSFRGAASSPPPPWQGRWQWVAELMTEQAKISQPSFFPPFLLSFLNGGSQEIHKKYFTRTHFSL